jgi:hypothetical protein
MKNPALCLNANPNLKRPTAEIIQALGKIDKKADAGVRAYLDVSDRLHLNGLRDLDALVADGYRNPKGIPLGKLISDLFLIVGDTDGYLTEMGKDILISQLWKNGGNSDAIDWGMGAFYVARRLAGDRRFKASGGFLMAEVWDAESLRRLDYAYMRGRSGMTAANVTEIRWPDVSGRIEMKWFSPATRFGSAENLVQVEKELKFSIDTFHNLETLFYAFPEDYPDLDSVAAAVMGVFEDKTVPFLRTTLHHDDAAIDQLFRQVLRERLQTPEDLLLTVPYR